MPARQQQSLAQEAPRARHGTLRGLPRLFLLASSVLIGSAALLPLWKISLHAPQYPEGLRMKIWARGISGDLNNINELNHYIGMRSIQVSDFKEFRYLSWLLLVLALVGLLAWASRGLKLLWIYVACILLTGAAGLFDFYRWEYAYGHQLDPRAAIKIPGMSYQPPLFGYRQLLNFLAASFPDLGGWMVILAGLLAMGVLVWQSFRSRSF